MEIGPEVFIRSDECHRYLVGLMGEVLACERHGILKGDINVEPIMGGVEISVSGLFALAQDGTIVQVEKLEASLATNNDGYIIIRQEGSTEIGQEGIPYKTPRYKCCISDIQNGDIIIGKIDNRRMNDSYIPPCYTIDAHPRLRELCDQCIKDLEEIKTKMASKNMNGDTTLLELLAMELNDLSLKESPKELYRLLSKIIYCLNKLNPATTYPETTTFINKDIAESLIPLRDYLVRYNQALDTIVETPKGIEREYDF